MTLEIIKEKISLPDADVLKCSDAVMRYFDKIVKVGNENREAFGFLSESAYLDNIEREKIWVCVDNDRSYLGHIMYGGKDSERRIFQIYSMPAARNRGIASLLIKELEAHAESEFCLNLRADIANDLTSAIRFYQGQGFHALKLRDKKNTTGREVKIFNKRLSTPSLLPIEEIDISLHSNSSTNEPKNFVIDLNVFISLIRNRSGGELITSIIRASLSGEFNLFVTPEFKEELLRNKIDNDVLLDFAESTLPVLPAIGISDISLMEDEIRQQVFPNRSKSRKSSVNDLSDIRHLAYCIKHKKSGFITEEKAILAAKKQLRQRYELTVLSPSDFKIDHLKAVEDSSLSIPHQSQNDIVQLQEKTDIGVIENFIKNDIDASFFFDNESTRGINQRSSVLVNDEISAVYVAKTIGNRHDCLEGILITNDIDFKSRQAVLDHLVEHFLKLVARIKAKRIAIYISSTAIDLELLCLQRGFQRERTKQRGLIKLVKISAPQLITAANWKSFNDSFLNQTGIELPYLIPDFARKQNGRPFIHAVKDGKDCHLSVNKLELFISPSLILLPKRAGAIIPIQPAFSSNLLVRDNNMLPFPTSEEALLRREKAYYKTPSHLNFFPKGMPLVFYESKNGRGAIGSARIISTEVCSVDTALKSYRRFGVFAQDELNKYADKNGDIQVIIFDNFVEFHNHIPLKQLKDLGCAKANMVGPEKLSFKALYNILHAGMGIPTKDVIISIQPQYVAKILSGKKTIELRKKPFPANGGVRIWIYSTKPSGAIEATAYVTKYEKDTPEAIWQKYKKKCGISKKDFDTYYDNCDEAYALTICDVRKLNKKIKLVDLKEICGAFTPPQYFRYLDHNSILWNHLLDCLPLEEAV